MITLLDFLPKRKKKRIESSNPIVNRMLQELKKGVRMYEFVEKYKDNINKLPLTPKDITVIFDNEDDDNPLLKLTAV